MHPVEIVQNYTRALASARAHIAAPDCRADGSDARRACVYHWACRYRAFTSVHGTKPTNRAGLAMSVDAGKSEVARKGQACAIAP
jgi:hypothetical protein